MTYYGFAAEADAGDEQGDTRGQLRAVHLEGCRSGAVLLHGNLLLLFIDGVFILWVEEQQACRASDVVVGGIEDAGGDDGMVAVTQEARHIGLHHDFLAGHGLAINHSAEHFLCVCHSHEAPRSKTLWQSEAQGHIAIAVSGELGHEECRLVEVRPHLLLFLLATGFFSLYGLFKGANSHFLQGIGSVEGSIGFNGLCHHHRLFHHLKCSDSTSLETPMETSGHPTGGIETMVEGAESERWHNVRDCPQISVPFSSSPEGIIPVSIGCGLGQ